jgi:hypothetical protein
VIAYGCLIKREEARREHMDYIYTGVMSQHPHFTATQSFTTNPHFTYDSSGPLFNQLTHTPCGHPGLIPSVSSPQKT